MGMVWIMILYDLNMVFVEDNEEISFECLCYQDFYFLNIC